MAAILGRTVFLACAAAFASCASVPWTAQEGAFSPYAGETPAAALPATTFLERLKTAVYVYTEPFDGRYILKQEAVVRRFLECVLENAPDYALTAWERRAINNLGPKSSLLLHSFYVVEKSPSAAGGGGRCHTISFYATSRFFVSTGAWAMDTEKDTASYKEYLEGGVSWNVRQIAAATPINTSATITRILEKMDSPTRYYYQDHVNDKPGRDNCNTALWETLTLD